MKLGLTLDLLQEQPEDRCIVRISTSSWKDKRGIHIRKDINYLRKLCIGYNLLEEDASSLYTNDIVDYIHNLYEVDDGVYQVVTCNESIDYETGYIDGYDYKLIPYKEEE
jgi:hypothetical protein